MQIGMIGLGRMGANLARRLMRGGHRCVVFDEKAEATRVLEGEGAMAAATLEELVGKLVVPRILWVMLPAGEITEATIARLQALASAGDVVIDGGNTFWKDDVRRAKTLAANGIHYLDVGTSGGVWGLERGYCLMIGGPQEIVTRLDPVFSTLAPGRAGTPPTPGREKHDRRAESGYIHAGPSGAGHFVKMIHNGIEYGMMQAFAEGFEILSNAGSDRLPKEFRLDLNLPDIAEVWRHGSVVSSWLLDLIAISLAEDERLSSYSGFVQDSGEGRWTVQTAIEEAVPATVLTAALYTRFRSRIDHSFSEKLLSAMRKQFGGHVEAH
ncbi:MAG: phosphogluconate dehydrogenase (NAD(+)-dependent, decarboxylating) [Pseudorhodoplanes sp.]